MFVWEEEKRRSTHDSSHELRDARETRDCTCPVDRICEHSFERQSFSESVSDSVVKSTRKKGDTVCRRRLLLTVCYFSGLYPGLEQLSKSTVSRS